MSTNTRNGRGSVLRAKSKGPFPHRLGKSRESYCTYFASSVADLRLQLRRDLAGELAGPHAPENRLAAQLRQRAAVELPAVVVELALRVDRVDAVGRPDRRGEAEAVSLGQVLQHVLHLAVAQAGHLRDLLLLDRPRRADMKLHDVVHLPLLRRELLLAESDRLPPRRGRREEIGGCGLRVQITYR